MKEDIFSYHADDQRQLTAYSWLPEKPRLVVQLVHGMMEHAGRYAYFARWMAEKGIAVYAEDHRGHGRSAGSGEYREGSGYPVELGFFAEKDGWNRVVEDIHQLTGMIRESQPGIPVVLMGHSVGSALARTYTIRYGKDVDGLVLSGVLQQPSILLVPGIGLAGLLTLIMGKHQRSFILKELGYGSYNKRFRPARTDFDWLTSVEEKVNEYVNDPLCGFPSTNAFYKDLFLGMLYNNRKANLEKIPKELPVYIFAGDMDASGFFGKAPVIMERLLRSHGMINIEKRIYPGGRHEMLNEHNREQVYQDLLNWMNGQGYNTDH